MDAREVRRMTLEEYVAFEPCRPERWEYAGGAAFAMAGATPRHNAIVMNLNLAVGAALEGKPSFALGSGQKLATPATRSFHYPDLTVLCGKPVLSPSDEHAITNPTVIVEVLSPSTADYDRGEKLDHYETIDTLQEVLLVFSDKKRVEHRKRVAASQWLVTDYVGGAVALESIGITLAVDDLYADLDRVAAS